MVEDLNIAKNRILNFRLLIDTPEGLQDVSDYLTDLEIERGDTSRIGTGQSGTDNTVATMSFTLHNDGRVGDTDRVSFSPRDEDSPMNNWDGEYNPLLFPNVEVIFQIAMFDYRDKSQFARWEVIEDDTWEKYEDMTWEELIEHVKDTATFSDITWPAEDDWITMFQGYLGDDIRVSAHSVTCEMRDLAKPMQDKLVEELQEYGDTDNPPTAEEVIREIMDENGYEDYPFDPDEDSDGSGFSITEYQVEYVSVWQAIQEIAAERGWFLGFRWDTDEGEYRLKFLEPDRAMDADSADYEIDWSTDFYDDEFNLSDKDIRNACKVVYRNRDSGEIENVTYEDQESIDTYGRKFMQFEEEDTSLIDTEEEAEQLAEAAVKDLRELPAGQDVTLPICPELDVLMGVNINDPRLSSSKDFIGIESVRHSFTFGEDPSYETYIVGSGYVSGGHKKWIDRDARSGVKSPFFPESFRGQKRKIYKPTGVEAEGIIKGVAVSFDKPQTHELSWAESEVHISSDSNFTPSSDTLKKKGRETYFEITRGLESGEKYYIKVIHIASNGSKSEESNEINETAGKVNTAEVEENSITDDAILKVTDEDGTSTTNSSSDEKIPNFEIEFTLDESYRVLVLMRVSFEVRDDNLDHAIVRGFVRLYKDGSEIRGQALSTDSGGESDVQQIWAPVVIMDYETLDAGTHKYEGYFKLSEFTDTGEVTAYTRELIVSIFKR